MSIIGASGGIVVVKGVDGQERRLSVLTMQQIGELGAWWRDKLRERFSAQLDKMGVTLGQRLTALRDFEMDEPKFWGIMRFGQTPEGIDQACKLALAGELPECLGPPIDQAEIASRLLQLITPDPTKAESIADPTPAAQIVTGISPPPPSAVSTTSTPGA